MKMGDKRKEKRIGKNKTTMSKTWNILRTKKKKSTSNHERKKSNEPLGKTSVLR
jgi:hypothetical protein